MITTTTRANTTPTITPIIVNVLEPSSSLDVLVVVVLD